MSLLGSADPAAIALGFAGRNELARLHDRALSARRQIGGPERGTVQASVDRDVTDRCARHEVRELCRAREARALLEDAMHEGGAPVDAAERAAEDDADALARRPGLLERVLDDDRGQARREVEPPRARHVEEGVGIDRRDWNRGTPREARRTPSDASRPHGPKTAAPVTTTGEPARVGERAARRAPRGRG